MCWKSYASNPAVVDVLASVDGKNFERLGTVQGKEIAGPQFFQIRPVHSRFNYLQLTITETFGANKTYLNQVFLLEEMPGERIIPETDLKALLQKQLSNLQENVRNMQADQMMLPSPPPQLPPRYSLPRPKSTEGSEKHSPLLLTETSAKEDDLSALHETIKALGSQVKELQEQVSGQKNLEVLREFKRQLLVELLQKEEHLAQHSFDSPQFPSSSLQDFLHSWQERVLEPRLAQFESHILDLLHKPKLEDMMQKLQAKMKLRNEKLALLEKQQRGSADTRYRDSYSSLY